MTPDEPTLELPGLVRDRVKEGRAKAAATRKRRQAEAEITDVEPVARVLLDLVPAHLDRLFDYAVPVAMAEAAQPGVRVKARFAGQDVDGFVIERAEASAHQGRLQPLRRVVSAEPVLTPAVAELAGALARHYAGTRADVLRLAIPPRHAQTEKQPSVPAPTPKPWRLADATTAWAGHEPAAAFLRHLAGGGAPRAVWHAAPGASWPELIAHTVAASTSSGRGALVCVPDGRDVVRLTSALEALLGPHQCVALTADAGPAARYRDFLAVRRGAAKVVVGTRAAAFAPVADLGLVVIWDDGDPLHAEPRAPYPHVREVLATRAVRERAAVLVGGFARSVEGQALITSGWAHEIRPERQFTRARARVGIAGASDRDLERDPLTRVSRVPREAFDLIRVAVREGPVLVQTPRRGYAAALACERCRTPSRCARCQGPLRLAGPTSPPSCRWCGVEDPEWSCPVCAHRGLRAPVIGDARTAEELGRMFPGVRVLTSSGDRIRTDVPARPAVVVATPGAEPVAAEGYAGVVLLDTWLLLGFPDLRTEEEAVRRWSNAIGLAGAGGRVLAVGSPDDASMQALVRWGQPQFAAREAAAREEAGLPPATRLATIAGSAGALDDALTLLALPEGAEVLGPVEDDATSGSWRAVLRAPRALGPALADALGELQRLRAARKLDAVRVQLDPWTL